MSTWTDEKHEDVRGFAVVGHLGHTNYAVVKEAFGYLNDALDEIERLRAALEAARTTKENEA